MKDFALHHIGPAVSAMFASALGFLTLGMGQVPAEFNLEKIGALGVLALFGWLGFQFFTQTIKENTKAIGDNTKAVNNGFNRVILTTTRQNTNLLRAFGKHELADQQDDELGLDQERLADAEA